jgi:hypothetical protein
MQLRDSLGMRRFAIKADGTSTTNLEVFGLNWINAQVFNTGKTCNVRSGIYTKDANRLGHERLP